MLQIQDSFITVRKATVADVADIVPLFSAYRKFYKISSEPETLHSYLTDRLMRDESVIYLAFFHDNIDEPVGFAQYYRSFNSLALATNLILYDLFVVEVARSKGVASKLISTGIEFARAILACEIVLQTAVDNSTAIELYERIGFKRENDFHFYCLSLGEEL
jgi:ribosomal protein S18 acetylase RimI-like enzyme